jgi:hypothetical protein
MPNSHFEIVKIKQILVEKGFKLSDISEMTGLPLHFFKNRPYAKSTVGYLRMCKILGLNPFDYVRFGVTDKKVQKRVAS